VEGKAKAKKILELICKTKQDMIYLFYKVEKASTMSDEVEMDARLQNLT
jgi:hypothetical protein